MKTFVLALALFCLAEARPNMKKLMEPRASFGVTPYIIGGSPVSISSHPHQISLQLTSGSHTCSGSIMSSTKIASAAHCTLNSASNYRIRAGSSDRTSGGQVITVSRITNHPSYCSSCGGFPNDISTLTLSSALSFNSNVQPINLATSDFAGQTCTITGWGRTGPSDTLPTTLQGADIAVISNSECASRMSIIASATINSGHICVYDSANSKGACNGDSGGPLRCGNDLAGITSWGVSVFGSCFEFFPMVYTRVSYFRTWLINN